MSVLQGVLVRYSQACCVAAAVQSVTIRGINNYRYVTKKKRIDEAQVKSLKWAEPIFKEHAKKTFELQTDDAESDTNDEPHMLHVVYLIQQTRGRPWWEKKIIEQLQLEGRVRFCVQLARVY